MIEEKNITMIPELIEKEITPTKEMEVIFQGGTNNYEQLDNKPQINNVELVGNKTLEELGIKQTYTANDISFEDGQTFQEKYDSGQLKGEKGDIGEQGPKGDSYQVTEQDLQNIANDITTDANSKFNQNVENKTEIFNQNVDNILNVTNQILPKNSVEGENVIFNDGLDMNMFDFKAKGKSTQIVTTGKNLFNIKTSLKGTISPNGDVTEQTKVTKFEIANNSITFSSTEAWKGIVSDFIKVEEGQYTLSFQSDNKNVYQNLYCYNINKEFVKYLTGSTTQTSTYSIPSDVVYVRFIIQGNASYQENTDVVVNNIQLEKGSTATSYEPFTNGVSSPSPDLPSEIISVEKDINLNIINGIQISNNQLEIGSIDSANGNNLTGNNRIRTIDYINKTEFKYLKYENLTSTIVFCYDNNKTYLGRISDSWQIDNPLEINLLPNTTYIRLVWRYDDDRVITSTNELKNVYLYNQHNQININIGEEKLRSVENIADELTIDLSTGDYYKVENIGEHIFNGNENISQYSTNNPIIYAFAITVSNVLRETSTNVIGKIKCNKLIATSREAIFLNVVNDGIALGYPTSDFYKDIVIYTNETKNMDVTQFKQWLVDNNLIVNYISKTPTTKLLGTLLAEDLAKLKTFSGYNNIYVNTNVGLIKINLTYGLDLKKYIDNKLAIISAQLI